MRFLPIFIACFLVVASPAGADSWRPPEVQTTYSPSQAFRFITEPRDIKSRLAYFEAKAAGRELPQATPARGRLERKTESGWEVVWTIDLANEVAPVTALVSDDGLHVITFDNWHSIGFGDDVVVIYGTGGALVRSLSLDQVIPSYMVDALPRSVSSRYWRAKETRILGETLELSINDLDESVTAPAFNVLVSLKDGTVEPVQPAILAAVQPRFCAAHIRVVFSHNESIAYERQDLMPLAVRGKDAWPRYQFQVVQRLTTEAPESFRFGLGVDPFELLPKGEYMYEDFRDSFRMALQASVTEAPVRWFSSRDLDAMSIEIERTAKKIKPNQLDGVEMHFLTVPDHWSRIESALAKSGARLFLADISVPIPQRPERLAELPPDRSVDSACTKFAN